MKQIVPHAQISILLRIRFMGRYLRPAGVGRAQVFRQYDWI